MFLKIMHKDRSTQEISVKRVMTIDTPAGQLLYYEHHADVHGHGQKIPVANLICWEVNAPPVQGGSQNLIL